MRVQKGKVRAPEIGRMLVDSARMYFLVDSHEFSEHELELRCSVGVTAFALTFPSCVDPVASALHATTAPAL